MPSRSAKRARLRRGEPDWLSRISIDCAVSSISRQAELRINPNVLDVGYWHSSVRQMEIGVLASVPRLLILGVFCVAAGACGVTGVPDRGWTAAEDRLQSAIVSSTGYLPGSVEVLASPARVNVSISDRELARADHATRERVAKSVVAAVQVSMAANARLADVGEIRVVIVHPEIAHGLLSSTHAEDVMEFRKGPNQQFYWDVL
jgi:hypothetical protein